MKIVIINQHPYDLLGGSEIQCNNIATHLTRMGHHVVYLAVNGAKNSYDTSYSVIPIKKLNPFHLYNLLKNIQPDLIYWRYNKIQLLTSAIISKLIKSRFVYSMSHVRDSQIWVGDGQTIFAQVGWYRGVRIRSVLYDILSFLPLKGAINYSAIPLFVDGVVSLNVDYLKDMPVKKKIAIHNSMPKDAIEFHWPKPYVTWVANVKYRKNPEKFLQLAQALSGTGVDFLMVGSIQDVSYNHLITAGEQNPNFHFLGPKSPSEVNGILKNALFLVHTCDPEGFGNNFIQAWLQGKPTISLYFDPEGIIEREKIGYLSGTFSRLVEQTRFLIENEAERITMGQKAQTFALENFDAETNVGKLEVFLKEIVYGSEKK